MKIFTDEITRKLAANGATTAAQQRSAGTEPDHKPVVKVFDPTGGATWLLTESTPGDPDRLFGLCDLGMGEPELGYVSRAELETARASLGLRLERDLYFDADKTLSAYALKALTHRRIMA
jgi:hypothetical protein